MAKIEFTTEIIEELTDMLKFSDMGKIHIKNGDFEICVEAKKNSVINAPAPTVAQSACTDSPAAADVQKPVEIGNIVTSPIIGTFYTSPSPDKDPFVRVGQTVQKGDVLFIVESMKLMNEVQSDFDGVVKQICVKDAEGVEFGQKIMIIE